MNRNQFIAHSFFIDGNFEQSLNIPCNRIETTQNATLVYGIMEDSNMAYDILIASIPSSRQVSLMMNSVSDKKAPEIPSEGFEELEEMESLRE